MERGKPTHFTECFINGQKFVKIAESAGRIRALTATFPFNHRRPVRKLDFEILKVNRCITGCSLRSGLATTAGLLDSSLTAIMKQGRWKSVQVARQYVRNAELWNQNVTGKIFFVAVSVIVGHRGTNVFVG